MTSVTVVLKSEHTSCNFAKFCFTEAYITFYKFINWCRNDINQKCASNLCQHDNKLYFNTILQGRIWDTVIAVSQKIGIVHHSVKQNNCKIAWCVLTFESNCNTGHIFISQRAECWKIAQRRSTVILTTSCIDTSRFYTSWKWFLTICISQVFNNCNSGVK